MFCRNILLIATLTVALFGVTPGAYAIVNCPNPEPGLPATFVYFDIGSTQINAEGMAKIEDAVKRIKDLYIRKVCLTGKADKQGNAAANMDLSIRRADAVANALIHKGVNAQIISISGKGEAYGDWITMFQNSPQDRSVRIVLTR
jgi:hypothetical protein